MDPVDESFAAKVKVLQEDVEHHVEEEEASLFPNVERLTEQEELEAIGDAMEETAEELKRDGNPRLLVPGETGIAAPL